MNRGLIQLHMVSYRPQEEYMMLLRKLKPTTGNGSHSGGKDSTEHSSTRLGTLMFIITTPECRCNSCYKPYCQEFILWWARARAMVFSLPVAFLPVSFSTRSISCFLNSLLSSLSPARVTAILSFLVYPDAL